MIDRVEPELPGVRITAARGTASLLQVANQGPRELEVLAPRGEPFLRVGPRGTFANLDSGYWYQSGNPDGRGVPPAGAERRRSPRWRLVSREPVWDYYEHRLHPSQVQLPRAERGTRKVLRLLEWAVPLRHGGRSAKIAGHIEFRPVLGAVVPALLSSPRPLPGVTVSVLPGRYPGLLLQSAAKRELTVEGRAGEPFARIGPGGVEVNLRSPTHADDQKARGERTRVAVDADGAPLWRRVATAPSYAWLESRVRYAPEQPPEDVLRRERPVRLAGWAIPIASGGRRVELRGATNWLPTGPSGVPERSAARDGAGAPLWLAGALLVIALTAAGAWRLRHR